MRDIYRLIIIVLCIFPVTLSAQIDESKITLEKKKIVILPAETGNSKYADISEEVAGIASNKIIIKQLSEQ